MTLRDEQRKGGGDPHRRPDRERQVRRGARACGALRRDVVNADSMQVYRDLSVLTARPTPDEERRAPHACSARSTARSTSRSADGLAAARPWPRRRAAADLRRRHGALFPRADRGPVRHSARAGTCAKCAPAPRVSPPPSCTPSGGPGPCDRRPSQPHRPAADFARAGGRRGDGPPARRIPGRAGRRRCAACEWGGLFLAPTGEPAAVSIRASTRCWSRARSTRSRHWRGAGSIRRCRSCAPTARRISSPISKGGCRWTRPREPRSWKPAITPSASSPGRATR